MSFFLSLFIISVLSTSFSAEITAEFSNGKKILVLLDNWAIRETHSTYFKMLRDKGYELTFKMADDKSLALTSFGEYVYNHLIIFAPSVQEFGGRVDVKAIQDFIDSGSGNVLIAGSSNIGDAIRELGSECGVELDEERTYLIDHQNFDAVLDNSSVEATAGTPSGLHTTLVVESNKHLISLHGSDSIVGAGRHGANPLPPLLFSGVGMHIDPENPLVLPILRASSSAYSFNPTVPIEEYPSAIGTDVTMIAAMQARNNARVIIAGSIDFFSDRFFFSSVQHAISGKKWDKSGNEALAVSLSEWLFKERGVLRVGRVTHHKIDPKAPLSTLDNYTIPEPQHYTVLEHVEYSIEVFEYVNHEWVPFKANDVQLEFVRIDPFVRKTLLQRNGKYYLRFKLPDVYGVFKFLVDYKRIGYTSLFSSVQVPVRPLQHTQYERFIFSASPYYLSAFSMMLGLLMLSCVFLYHRDRPAKPTTPGETAKNK